MQPSAPSRGHDQMLRRKEDQRGLASLIDSGSMLINLWCVVLRSPGKEHVVQSIIDLNGSIEVYEKKIYDDLLTNDFMDGKLKLKSKFNKEHAHHPKSLMVEWLKNNNLGGNVC